jgi:hypothetical protein
VKTEPNTLLFSRLLKLARLPSVIVNAFAHTAEISETCGLALMDAWEDPSGNAADDGRDGRSLGAADWRTACRVSVHVAPGEDAVDKFVGVLCVVNSRADRLHSHVSRTVAPCGQHVVSCIDKNGQP